MLRPSCSLLILAIGLGLSAHSASLGADGEVLVKVGDYHLKTERYGAAVVAGDGEVYVIGGANRGGVLGDIERFDMRTQQVARITNKLTPRVFHGAVLADGKIFVLGGAGYSLRPEEGGARRGVAALLPEGKVDIYDIATGRISKGPPLPTPRSSAATVLFDNRVYVIGGSRLLHLKYVERLGLVELLDLKSGAWTTGVPMPIPRDCAGVLVDDQIVVPGGYRGASVRLAEVEYYLPQQKVWKKLPDLCEPMSAYSVARLGSYVFMFGNYGGESDVVALNLRAGNSQVIHPGYLRAQNTAAVSSGGFIFVVGGERSGTGEALDDIQIFTLKKML